jgi:membrane-associated phospholipid phosphatase
VFEHQLPDGIWWSWVAKLVAANGAQKDIFPSLHTALPLFLLLFSFDHRKRAPFAYTWPALGFFVANIIAATMFLRWHYVIDVVAGVVLATTAQLISRKLSFWEPARRADQGPGPPWPRYSD